MHLSKVSLNKSLFRSIIIHNHPVLTPSISEFMDPTYGSITIDDCGQQMSIKSLRIEVKSSFGKYRILDFRGLALGFGAGVLSMVDRVSVLDMWTKI